MPPHPTEVLTALENNGILPQWVAVGNEANDGMLCSEGKASVKMNNYAQLIHAGYEAVKLVFLSAKVIVHVSNGAENALFRCLFEGLKNKILVWQPITEV